MSANPVQAVIDHYERGDIQASHQQLELVANNQFNVNQTIDLLQLAYHVRHLDLVERLARGGLQTFGGEYKFYTFLKRAQLESLRLHDALKTVEAARQHPYYELNRPIIDTTYLKLRAYVSACAHVAAHGVDDPVPFELAEPPTASTFGRAPLNVNITQAARDYITYYKYNQTPHFETAYSHQPHRDLDEAAHRFIYFFCMHHLDDYGDIYPYIPTQTQSMLNIGGGIGMSELMFREHFDHPLEYSLIELEEMTHVEHYDPSIDTFELETPLRLVEEAEAFLKANGFSDDQLHLCTSTDYDALKDKQYDLIVSFRSWLFLYPFEVYQDLVQQTLADDGTLIVDVNPESGNAEKLSKMFESVREISGNHALKRMVCRKIRR